MNCNRKSPLIYLVGKRGFVHLVESSKDQVKMAPAEFESALNILKGYCFTVKLWNQIP